MSYTSKYSSNFYNFHGNYVEVDIRKKDYSGAVTPLRNTEVFIEVNFQDNNTPIIGTGASIVILNQGGFADLDDLLSSTEKQFMCVIKYGGATVFQGFSICDLNEQQFMPFARVKLQFTDYLKRLEGHFADNFFIGSNTDLLTLVQELIVTVGFGAAYELWVNSTLFETHQTKTNGNTFLKQTYVENNMFFSEPNTYDDVYEMVNKVLKPFGCFLYSFGDKWVIERQEDIVRGGGAMDPWVRYTLYQVGNSEVGLKQEYNKQAGDFKYVDGSQILEYASGLRTLIINFKDKQYDTFVFNDYTTTMSVTNETFPTAGTLALKTWYRHTNVMLLQSGFDYKDMSSFIKWMYAQTISNHDREFAGLYYAFQIQFPPAPEKPIILNINYKQSVEIPLAPTMLVRMRFCLRIDQPGETFDGFYIVSNGTDYRLFSPIMGDLAFKTDFIINKPESVFSNSQSINLTDIVSRIYITPDIWIKDVSYWDLLGNPETLKFIIMFFPIQVFIPDYDGSYEHIWTIPSPQRLGDVEVTLTGQKVINKLTYYINEDFVNTEEVDIDFFDLPNVNFANGLMYGLGGIGNDAIGKTKLWTSEKSPVADELMDIYAANKFRNYARTIHKLKGRIMYDGYIKPLAVITDDNRSATEFILQGYTWDLNNGVYDIVAEEYTSEEIIIDTEGDSSGGGDGDPGVTPSVPTNLTAVQLVAGSSVDISWDVSTGASGYILQRQPYYNGITWISSWKTVWEGYNAFTADPIQYEAIPPNSMHFSYRVLAKTTLLYSAYSATEVLIWTA